ncbi:ABC transporter permease, partial [Mesorhizobium sp. M00.F.Ca.ET.186.01.1.1]
FEAAEDPISFASQGIFGTTSPPSRLMFFYTLFYGAATLALAVRLFGKRDV